MLIKFCIFLMIFLCNIVSLLFISSNSPISMVILVMANSLNLCVLIFLSLSLSWFSFVLFLIFLGGLMVLFIYICSIASNEVNSFKPSMSFVLLNMVLSLVMCLSLDYLANTSNLIFINSVSKLIVYSNCYVFLLTLIYLILTLFVSVVIAKMKFGPVRAKKN